MHFFLKPSLNYSNFKRPAKCHIFPHQLLTKSLYTFLRRSGVHTLGVTSLSGSIVLKGPQGYHFS